MKTENWIWSSDTVTKNSVSYFRKDYELKTVPTAVEVRVSAHNHLKFYVNSKLITGYVTPAPAVVPKDINYLSYSFTGEELSALISGDQLALAAAVQYMGDTGMNYMNASPALWAEVKLTFADGSEETLKTGTDWKALADTPYAGNTPSMSNRHMNAQIDYDAQKMPEPLAWTAYGYDDSAWVDAVKVDAAASYQLRRQVIPEGAIHEEITPAAVGRQQAGYQVFDVGRIASGWVKLTATAPAGTKVCIRYSEDLIGDTGDEVVKHNAANEPTENYCDYYTFAGTGEETFAADFDYKAFRYFEVVGLTETITVEQVTMQHASTGIEHTAGFNSSDELLNAIYQASVNTQINNMLGMPVDCPHREQSQYLADTQLQYAFLSYGFSDFSAINYKTLLDFASQQKATGRFTFVSPSERNQGDSIPEWDLRYSNMLYNYYLTSGDLDGTAAFYDNAVKNVNYYLGYLESSGLLADIDGWNISDHPEKTACKDDPGVPPTVVNILLYDSLNHLSKIATLLNKTEDAAIWSAKAEKQRVAINLHLLNHETGLYYQYHGAEETNEGITAMGINLGVAEPYMLEKQMAALSVKGLTNTSVVLTYELFNAVMANGTAVQKEAVYERIIRSWGQMINAGDSTLWEGFEDKNSHSHAWGGYVGRIMLQYMLGISYNGVNYTKVAVAPWLPEEMSNAEGFVTIPDGRGQVGVALKRNADSSLTLQVENKPASAITVAVPGVSGNAVIKEAVTGIIFENGTGSDGTDLTYLSNDAEYVRFTAAANKTYTFTSTVSK